MSMLEARHDTLHTPCCALQIDLSAPFAVAFTSVGYMWAQYIVSAGAVLAIADTVVAVQYSLRCVAAAAS